MRKLLFFLFGVVIGTAIIVGLVYVFSGPPQVDPKMEYYRGHYDACVALTPQFIGFSTSDAREMCSLYVLTAAKGDTARIESIDFPRIAIEHDIR